MVDTRHALAVERAGKWQLSSSGYAVLKGRVFMHKAVLENEGVTIPDGHESDHINGDSLDNRVCNLRVCTCQQNRWNRKKRSDGTTSRFKGVYRDGRGRWIAQIRVSGKKTHLGSFGGEEQAAAAYRAAAEKVHGEFFCTRGEP